MSPAGLISPLCFICVCVCVLAESVLFLSGVKFDVRSAENEAFRGFRANQRAGPSLGKGRSTPTLVEPAHSTPPHSQMQPVRHRGATVFDAWRCAIPLLVLSVVARSLATCGGDAASVVTATGAGSAGHDAGGDARQTAHQRSELSVPHEDLHG